MIKHVQKFRFFLPTYIFCFSKKPFSKLAQVVFYFILCGFYHQQMKTFEAQRRGSCGVFIVCYLFTIVKLYVFVVAEIKANGFSKKQKCMFYWFLQAECNFFFYIHILHNYLYTMLHILLFFATFSFFKCLLCINSCSTVHVVGTIKTYPIYLM